MLLGNLTLHAVVYSINSQCPQQDNGVPQDHSNLFTSVLTAIPGLGSTAERMVLGMGAKNVLKWGIPVELQAGEINAIKMQKVVAGWDRKWTPCEDLAFCWGKCVEWVRGDGVAVSFWHWKCIVCSVLMKCASAALVLFSGWGSLLQFLCHLSFLHPTKLKFSNLMGQWDKKENQMTMTCGPNVNSRFSSLQYIQITKED